MSSDFPYGGFDPTYTSEILKVQAKGKHRAVADGIWVVASASAYVMAVTLAFSANPLDADSSLVLVSNSVNAPDGCLHGAPDRMGDKSKWSLSTAVLQRAHSLEALVPEYRATELLERAERCWQKHLGRNARLPRPVEIEADDGALLVEWRLDQRRLGVALEEDARESGWYAIDLRETGPSKSAGFLDTFEPEKQLEALLG